MKPYKYHFFLIFAVFISCSLPEQKDNAKYWIWLNHYEKNNYDTIFTKLNSVGITGIIIKAKVEEVKKIVAFADKYNISVHLWRWILNTQNSEAFNKNPEWASVNRNGLSTLDKKPYVDYYRFICPALPEVRSFVLSEITPYLDIEGLEGISLDYCRYVDVILPEQLWETYGIVQDKEYPEWDYGYHPYILEKFSEKYGYEPLELSDPSQDEKWVRFREAQVNELVNLISKKVQEKGKLMSASPFPTPSLARKHVRQDWGNWNLDYVFPMIYNGFYKEEGIDWFTSCLKECMVEMKPKNTKVFPGIFAEGHRDNDFTLTQAMEASTSQGADGFALFSYGELTDSEWKEIELFIKNQK
jgi:uncharacterized lipoprotein YddW (UPF0748 family)